MTVPQFCELEGVSRATFYVWRKKLTDQSGGIAPGVDFAMIEDQAANPTSNRMGSFAPVFVTATQLPVAVRLPGGVCIEVPAGNLAALQAVVAEVMQQAALPTEGATQC